MADLANYVKFLRGTPSAYEALTVKDKDTLYFIAGTNQKVGKLYLGDVLVAGNVTDDGTSVLDSLGELTDVNLQGLVSGQVLGYNGTEWVPMNLPEAFEASVMSGATADSAGTAGYVPAPQSGDHVKFLRGDGTWAEVEIPSSTQVFETEIDGGADHITAINTAVGEATPQNGDIAIVKELIASGKRQYTAYVYSDGWKAMDGNYNAENVYFDEDITITTNVGNITVSNGNGTIPAAGKNLKQVFEAMYTKEDLSLSITQPAVSFTLSNSGSASGEVGTAITLPTATLSISGVGSYEYGSKDKAGTSYDKTTTGVTFTNLRAAFGATAASAVEGAYTEKKDVALTSGSVAYTAKDTQVTEPLFLDEEKSYTFSYSATYVNTDEPRKPVTNLGNFIGSDGKSTSDYESGTKAIAGSTKTGSGTWKAKGYRKLFWGYKLAPVADAPNEATDALADPTAITSAQVRALQKNGTSVPTTYTVPAGTKQVYFAFPAGTKSTLSIANKSALGAPVASEKIASTATNAIKVADARGTKEDGTLNGAVAYDLWYVNLDSSFSGEAELELTWA